MPPNIIQSIVRLAVKACKTEGWDRRGSAYRERRKSFFNVFKQALLGSLLQRTQYQSLFCRQSRKTTSDLYSLSLSLHIWGKRK